MILAQTDQILPLTDARPTAASEGHVILSTPSTSPTRSTPRMYHVFLINMILEGQEDDSSGGGVTYTMQEMRTLLQASRKRPEPGSPRVRWDGRSLRNRMRSGMHEMRWKARQPRGGLHQACRDVCTPYLCAYVPVYKPAGIARRLTRPRGCLNSLILLPRTCASILAHAS